ncbi:MAG: hypothetical protein Q9209_006468 [Squamulea sp. 1 TL-2023]
MDHRIAESAQNSGNTNTELLRKLSAAVNGHAVTATFACGGLIELTGTSKDVGPPGVTIRWDAGDYRDHNKILFPCSSNDGGALEALVQHCQPATFGLGNRDVLDEGYRKAGKLDNTAFSTNFHPHDYGIVDAVQQVLMPSAVGGARKDATAACGVRAELYKLNIYSAPSGKFLTHVDTPRGLTQFGSLVVCLPCAHEGGTLRVKHRGQQIEFAWADPRPKSIQWAAFYGDCEHEVLEVTSGHRVTLTYNLYFSCVDSLAVPTSDPKKLPLYDTVAQMIREPSFMRYGLDVGVHPILHKKTSISWRNDIENVWGGMSARKLLRGPSPGCEVQGDFVDGWLGHAPPTRTQVPRNAGGYYDYDSDLEDDQPRSHTKLASPKDPASNLDERAPA